MKTIITQKRFDKRAQKGFYTHTRVIETFIGKKRFVKYLAKKAWEKSFIEQAKGMELPIFFHDKEGVIQCVIDKAAFADEDGYFRVDAWSQTCYDIRKDNPQIID